MVDRRLSYEPYEKGPRPRRTRERLPDTGRVRVRTRDGATDRSRFGGDRETRSGADRE
ncbi:hypothetical protein [Fodinicola feengrottensis]|uniref:hypothetical protein n=1 Tax=Fodinicola feengrottensis TaxID=435914 RepID=UPI0013D71452|nr:hypothetical protein [Fodinicola feengrottensis]